jgi:hypothetical protein
LFGNVQPGDIKYKDLDNSGYIDESDVTKIGKSTLPEWTYSLELKGSYKGFDCSALLQATAGSSVNLLSIAGDQMKPFVNNGNAYTVALNAWAYYPDQGIDNRYTATFPRLTTETNNNNYRTSSFWIRNNDYLRVRNIEIGYTCESPVLHKVGMSKLRVCFNATNPFTFSKLLSDYNIDPEDWGSYPLMKTWSLGFTATF